MVNVEVMKEFLETYKYPATNRGVQAIYDEWLRQKTPLLEKFRKHPNWDEENLAIVFKEQQFERPFNTSELNKFYQWSFERIDDEIRKGKYITQLTSVLCYMDNILRYESEIREKVDFIKRYHKNFEYDYSTDYINLRLKRNKLKEYVDNIIFYETAICTSDGKEYYLDNEKAEKIKLFRRTMDYIVSYCDEKQITAEQAERISVKSKLTINEGLKLTKVINKLCNMVGIDKYVEMRHRNDNPENEMKDYGYNYHFALLADSISPVKYKRITVISLNPLDYWGMSFGYKWASCHTIDKYNIRHTCDSLHHYQGCYSAGTESYMLDKSSVIFYVVNEDYQGNVYYEQDKMNRVVFYINEEGNIMIQSRVYPDGRDGGDNSLSKQFREVMQKVVADIYDLNNFWTVKKGISECVRYERTKGVHYRDYEHYDDCNVSINKDMLQKMNEEVSIKRIEIGHDPICPVCGRTHGLEDNIMCESCQDGEEYDEDRIECPQCGEMFDEDDGIEIDGTTYCCRECAEEAGYRLCYDDYCWYREEDLYLCEDDDRWHDEEHSYTDDYDGYYYSGDPYIITNDGYYYSSKSNAESAGYHKEFYTDEWMKESELTWDEHYECWFDSDRALIETDNGNYYIDEDSFFDKNPNGIKTDDEVYFENEVNAENAGYCKNEDGNWVMRESEEVSA